MAWLVPLLHPITKPSLHVQRKRKRSEPAWEPVASHCPPDFGEHVLAVASPSLFTVVNESGDGRYMFSRRAWREILTVAAEWIVSANHVHEEGGVHTFDMTTKEACLPGKDTRRNRRDPSREVSLMIMCLGCDMLGAAACA